MRRVGLTGGIGSGKSTVADILASLGAQVIDADEIAREVVAPGSEGLESLTATFGQRILTPEGELDRQALAQIVFADPAERQRMNAIIHPLIGARTAQLVAALPSDAVLVHDVPLLVELNMQAGYDCVVVVDAPDELRIERLVARGLTATDARARLAAQSSREQRLAAADIVIDNSGDLEALRERVQDAWPEICGSQPLTA